MVRFSVIMNEVSKVDSREIIVSILNARVKDKGMKYSIKKE